MKILNYFRGVAREFGLVKWPTGKTTKLFTLAVLAISLFFGIYIGLFDILFAKILEIFINLRDGVSAVNVDAVTNSGDALNAAISNIKVEANSGNAAKVIEAVKEIKK